MVDDICWEWEQRTGMRLGLDVVSEIYQGDVNNYLWIEPDGGIECKGAYVKDLSRIDNDLPIINKAIREYMMHGTPVENTIYACDDLIQFQRVVKLSNKYDYVTHNGRRYNYKCYRVFASKRKNDGMVYKVKTGKNPEKFATTSEHSFIDNGNICGEKIPHYLDKEWYVDLAKARLRDKFGAEV